MQYPKRVKATLNKFSGIIHYKIIKYNRRIPSSQIQRTHNRITNI